MLVGVIVGRFQVPELHEGHLSLVKHVLSGADRCLILVGTSAAGSTPRNPLDYPTREAMLRHAFSDPRVTVLCIADQPTDEEWSHTLDSTVKAVYPLASQVVLYGGRDSFIPHYKGHHKTIEIQLTPSLSGTQIRQVTASKLLVSTEFREGMIYALKNQWPRVLPTVDIAVVRNGHLLLGRKPNETPWRLPGGFVDPSDENLETAAARELLEETSIIALASPTYIGSYKVKDWRYKHSEDGSILTNLMVLHHPFFAGEAKASDDLKESFWIPFEEVNNNLVETHRPLVRMLFNTLRGYSNERTDSKAATF